MTARIGSVAKASLPTAARMLAAALSGARRIVRQDARPDRRGVQARRLDTDGGRHRRTLEGAMVGERFSTTRESLRRAELGVKHPAANALL